MLAIGAEKKPAKLSNGSECAAFSLSMSITKLAVVAYGRGGGDFMKSKLEKPHKNSRV